MATKNGPTNNKRPNTAETAVETDLSVTKTHSNGHRNGTLKTSHIQVKQTLVDITTDATPSFEKIEELLTIIVRQQSDASHYEKIGSIRIFDVVKSPDTAILRHDRTIKKIFTMYDLRQALEDPTIKMIMVPDSAAVSRLAVSDICEYYRTTKTIFVEKDR